VLQAVADELLGLVDKEAEVGDGAAGDEVVLMGERLGAGVEDLDVLLA